MGKTFKDKRQNFTKRPKKYTRKRFLEDKNTRKAKTKFKHLVEPDINEEDFYIEE